jgi:predicted ABC-type transport system involved in lysophospholipase L1 biosynthesis ATPase subunit
VTDPPLVEIAGVVKSSAFPTPLRVRSLRVGAGERYTLTGFDAAAAETFVHLITGAALPDEGDVRVAGTSTRDIATDTAWLDSLDRFGLVTERAVLLEKLTIADNLALPITLAIDPIPDSVRPQVEQLADEVGLGRDRLGSAADALAPADRARLHLGRAIAADPSVLLVEYPTTPLDARTVASLGETIARVAAARGLAWIVLTDDERFAKAAGGTRLALQRATGELTAPGWWKRTFG